jgi:hypothetical protein
MGRVCFNRGSDITHLFQFSLKSEEKGGLVGLKVSASIVVVLANERQLVDGHGDAMVSGEGLLWRLGEEIRRPNANPERERRGLGCRAVTRERGHDLLEKLVVEIVFAPSRNDLSLQLLSELPCALSQFSKDVAR